MTRRQWAMLVAGGLVLAALCAAIILAPAQGVATAVTSHPPGGRAPSGILTLLTALAAIAQAVVAVIMVSGLRHSQRAADAAAATLVETKTANATSLRAYLAFPDISIMTFAEGQPMKARIVIKNFGRTPALNVKLFVSFETKPDVEEPDYALGDNPPHELVTLLGMIAPDAQITATPHSLADVSAQDFREVTELTRNIHLWGWVQYETFSEVRTTRFRFWNVPRPLTQVGALNRRDSGNNAT